MPEKEPPDDVQRVVDAIVPDIPDEFMTAERQSKLRKIISGMGGAGRILGAAEDADAPGDGKGGGLRR
ncbi:MAG: hypothetical protein EBV03_05170 [Proteobacteria bacterium]|nr:hypothetical protein [Pseudomonadota bacterium]